MTISIISGFFNSTILSSFVFLIAVCVLVYFTAKSIRKDYKRFIVIVTAILLAWFFAVFILSQLQFFSKNPLFIPNILVGFLVLFELLRRVYSSQSIQKLADSFPQHWLILIQTYRIVGVGFLILYAQGILPAEFAFPSGIGDIFVGISAPFVAYLYYRKKPYAKKLAIIWNIVGILDLIVALGVGFIGFPRPVQFVTLHTSTEPLSLFPLAIITLFAVPLAILMHSLSLRTIKKPLAN